VGEGHGRKESRGEARGVRKRKKRIRRGLVGRDSAEQRKEGEEGVGREGGISG